METFNAKRPPCLKPELDCPYCIKGRCFHVMYDERECPLRPTIEPASYFFAKRGNEGRSDDPCRRLELKISD
jgi:hypothetical protein